MSGFCPAFIYVCMFAHTFVGVCGGRRRASDSLELKIETVMSCPKWLLGTDLQVSARAANAVTTGPVLQPPPPNAVSQCLFRSQDSQVPTSSLRGLKSDNHYCFPCSINRNGHIIFHFFLVMDRGFRTA